MAERGINQNDHMESEIRMHKFGCCFFNGMRLFFKCLSFYSFNGAASVPYLGDMGTRSVGVVARVGLGFWWFGRSVVFDGVDE